MGAVLGMCLGPKFRRVSEAESWYVLCLIGVFISEPVCPSSDGTSLGLRVDDVKDWIEPVASPLMRESASL